MVLDPVTPSAASLHWSTIQARGSQARSFLQGQVTQDVDAPSDGERWTLLLRPDSVVVTAALVSDVSDAADGLDLVVPREVADDALARLRRFLLRVDCELTLVDDVPGPFATTGDLVEAGWPGANEFARELTPHSFGARVVERTISFTKGCYTGQELVGRLDARGAKVPWRLVRARGASLAAIEAALSASGPEGPRGVTTAVATSDGVLALGVAHRTVLDGSAEGVLIETL